MCGECAREQLGWSREVREGLVTPRQMRCDRGPPAKGVEMVKQGDSRVRKRPVSGLDEQGDLCTGLGNPLHPASPLAP